MKTLTINPKDYSCSITVEVTEKQGKALEKLMKKDDFGAYFWAEKIDWMNKGNVTNNGQKVIRIGGSHYVVNAENEYMKGHGGRKFYATMLDGSKLQTTNLWCQGDIPKELKNILVDNAKMLYN